MVGRAVGVVLALVALVGAGCLGGEGTATSASLSPSASDASLAQPADSVGSIEGTVTDDTQLPLSNATVQLLKTEHSTTTDDRGHFQFAALEPGTYTVAFDAEGYQSAGARTTVAAGEVTTVNIRLASYENLVVPYVEIVPKAGFIEAGTGNTHSQALWKAPQYFCSACKVPIEVPADVHQLMLEYTFLPAFDYPNHDEAVYFSFYRNTLVDGPSPTTHEYIRSGWLVDHANVTMARGDGGLKPGVDKVTLYIGGDRDPYVTYQQKVYVWFSLAHHAPIPPGHTGAPPKA